MSGDTSLIVADIGGTNARFAVATLGSPPDKNRLSQVRSYSGGNEDGVAGLLRTFLEELEGPAPADLCIGMAGPSDGRVGIMVNRDWTVDAAELEREFELRRALLVNDFAALSAAVPGLPESDCLVLRPGSGDGGPTAVVGPGTGLGVGLVLGVAGSPHVISTEGGHMHYVPARAVERELLAYLSPEAEYLAAETVLSGPGLVRIHQFLRERSGFAGGALTPAEITGAALAASDPLCEQTVDLFLSSLGSFAGDIVLAQGATGGLYLGGGVLPRLASLLPGSGFLERFVDKGPLHDYLARIPVRLITADFVALSGAAELFRDAS